MKTKRLVIVTSLVAVLILVAAALIVMLQGDVKTIGSHPSDVKGEALICEDHSISYPVFTYDEARSKDLKITADFYDKKLNAISLTYTLYYDDAAKINASEAHNHAAMNIDFGHSGFTADSFDANYSKLQDSMRMVLYANGSDFSLKSAKYFMINVKEELPVTIDEFQSIYKDEGFSCNIR